MGLISRLYNFTSGDTIRSFEVNAEFKQLINICNMNTTAISGLKYKIDELEKHIEKQGNNRTRGKFTALQFNKNKE